MSENKLTKKQLRKLLVATKNHSGWLHDRVQEYKAYKDQLQQITDERNRRFQYALQAASDLQRGKLIIGDHVLDVVIIELSAQSSSGMGNIGESQYLPEFNARIAINPPLP